MTRSPHYLPSFCGRFVVGIEGDTVIIHSIPDAAALVSAYRSLPHRPCKTLNRLADELRAELDHALNRAAELRAQVAA